MMRYLALLLVFFTLAYSAQAAGDYKQWWQKANELYDQKNYDSALQLYNKVAEEQPGSAEVYYNLGNTYYRLNDIGNAVLNYERALHLQPSYTEAADNLYLTQNRINNRIQPIPEIFFIKWWKSITRQGLANVYAIVALLLLLATVGYLIARRLGKISYNAPVQLVASAFILCGLFILLGMVAADRRAGSNKGVVMNEGTPMMAEPKYGKSLSLVPEGTTIHITGTQAGWHEITLPDGRNGWMQQEAISKI